MQTKKFIFLIIALITAGCTSAAEHRRMVKDETGDKLTVGKVQREIKVGMTSSQVVEILGSPNVLTTDEERREVWVYDKIATDVAYSTSEGGASLLLIGAYGSSGASSTSQRTLTVVIKFDNEGKVRDFAYHTSQF